MDDAVSEIVGEYAKQIEAQERAAQAKDAVVEAAMARYAALVNKDLAEWLRWSKVEKDACAALDRARKGEA